MMTTATQAALPKETALLNKPLTIKHLFHQSLPQPQHPQQNSENVNLTAWTKQNDHIQCTQTIPPTFSSPLDYATESNPSTPPSSSLSCKLMQRLWKQLMITKTMLNCLSNMISIKATSKPSRKNLYDLITNLPPIDPKDLLTYVYSSNSEYVQLYVQALHNHNQYRSKPTSPDCIKTWSTHYLLILLRSILQSTRRYTKDLLKAP